MTDNFEQQLNNFRNEADAVAKFIYADYALNHAASKSKRLLFRLNRTPTFWLSTMAAWQIAAYISLARIFDKSSRFNLAALVRTTESNIAVFGRDALSKRMREGYSRKPPWLSEYLDKAYYPSNKDISWLRGREQHYRAVYDRIVRPARNHRGSIGVGIILNRLEKCANSGARSSE